RLHCVVVFVEIAEKAKMKRHGGEDGYSYGYGGGYATGKRQRADGYQEALAAGKYELRLLVPSRGAGAVIGKGGESIKRLRAECDATLTIPDSQTPERIVTIVAEVDNVIRCVNEIIPRLDECLKTRDSDDEGSARGESELRLLVHQSHAGAIIGRGGYRIKELREETSTQLKVYSQCCPQSTERVIQIIGAPEKIIACVILIINMLKEIPIKGPSRPYESMFYDPNFVHEYGGFPPDRNYRGMGPRGGMYGGGLPPRAPRFPYGGRGMGMGVSPFPPAPFGGPMQTTQVTIPNELGGTIIGKGGERINRIREESGAHIVVEPQQPNSERIITISGSHAQIQTAQYLLQQCVRTSMAGRKYLSEH
uniref:K Homology domain-containing protein n=2 Tax=Parascaris univalens TaxID=6257 RepID=A0A915C9R4_PARUN